MSSFTFEQGIGIIGNKYTWLNKRWDRKYKKRTLGYGDLQCKMEDHVSNC